MSFAFNDPIQEETDDDNSPFSALTTATTPRGDAHGIVSEEVMRALYDEMMESADQPKDPFLDPSSSILSSGRGRPRNSLGRAPPRKPPARPTASSDKGAVFDKLFRTGAVAEEKRAQRAVELERAELAALSAPQLNPRSTLLCRGRVPVASRASDSYLTTQREREAKRLQREIEEAKQCSFAPIINPASRAAAGGREESIARITNFARPPTPEPEIPTFCPTISARSHEIAAKRPPITERVAEMAKPRAPPAPPQPPRRTAARSAARSVCDLTGAAAFRAGAASYTSSHWTACLLPMVVDFNNMADIKALLDTLATSDLPPPTSPSPTPPPPPAAPGVPVPPLALAVVPPSASPPASPRSRPRSKAGRGGRRRGGRAVSPASTTRPPSRRRTSLAEQPAKTMRRPSTRPEPPRGQPQAPPSPRRPPRPTKPATASAAAPAAAAAAPVPAPAPPAAPVPEVSDDIAAILDGIDLDELNSAELAELESMIAELQ